MTIVARTCTELPDDRGTATRHTTPKALSAFRERPAYVLLGDPGMGKTTAFRQEARALGCQGKLVSARDLANIDADAYPEWKHKTLLIDGLDEVRAGQHDPRLPLDRIRGNLVKLGKPPFRLSCRHADWLTTDQKSLATVSPSGAVAVLSLDPLDSQRAEELLRAHHNVHDVSTFLKEARGRGMDGLLSNPQSLDLLVRAVHDGRWPAGRTETFERACLAMAGEYNEEHLSVPSQEPERILDTAGRLCAVLLVSGISAFATARATGDADHPYMTVCGHPINACRQAVASRLFRHRATGRAEPVHRQVAEYVAARHLAKLIQDGLPSLRVLALISGPDGNVVSELRGLSAWLATHSPVARHHLIQRDPIGLVLYGDIQALSSADQHQALFDSLVRHPRQLEPTYRTAPAFAALATPTMQPVLERAIRNPPDGPDGELVADFVLRVLREAPVLPGLSTTLLETARDDSRWPRVRDAALRTFIHHSRNTDNDSDLLALLHDVREGDVPDPTDDFLGQLLTAHYPRRIPPSAVWDYMKESNELYGGAYMRFWISHLPSASSATDVAQLLDACVDRLADLAGASNPTLESCVARLLVRGLEAAGDDIEVGRLYSWLDAGVRLRVGQHESRDDATAIRQWIEARPGRHLELILEGAQRLPEDHWYAPYEAAQRLFGATLSAGLLWDCATAAKSMVAHRRLPAESLLRFAVQSAALDLQRLQDLVAGDDGLTAVLNRMREPPPPAPDPDRLGERQNERLEELQREARHRLETLHNNEAAFRNNTASPALLHGLARTYFGNFIRFTPDLGAKRLEELVAPHARLLDAIRTGLRLTLERRDVPDADEILRLRLRSRMHWLCCPYLAGLAEAEHAGAPASSWWTAARTRRSLAIYFAYAHGDYEPPWYRDLLAEHPAIVAEVQVQFAAAFFRAGISTGNTNLWHLAFDGSHAKVAANASLPLLRAFPPGANSDVLGDLEYLLLAALQHAEPSAFEPLIAQKLSRQQLPPRQRGRWLAAGCTVATTTFETLATTFVCAGRQHARTLHFASFFCPQERTVSPVEQAGADLAALLVRLVGRIVAPDELSEGIVTPAMEASTLVSQCIRVLAGDPHPGATAALAGLLRDPKLTRWQHALSRAADDQRVYRRDHEYRHPTAEQATETLNGGAPAGPADLAALVLDRLRALAEGMRSGSADGWKEYWNESPHRKPTDPKPEESCTQALLRGLRHVWPSRVTLDREVRYPNDVRPDLSASFGDYRLPIEVKRNDNRHLWHAARTQLIANFASDPATHGHGIYVVLWFGRDRTRFSPTGTRPATPADLQKQLEATLDDHERRTIFFLVIDVAAPPAHPPMAPSEIPIRSPAKPPVVPQDADRATD